MTWSIWKCKNEWIFENIPPTIDRCRRLLSEELKFLLFKLKPHVADNLATWMQSVHL
jgi:hypothetical protein